MPDLDKLLKEIDEKKAKIDQARPFPKIIVDKLLEYFTVEWTYTRLFSLARRKTRIQRFARGRICGNGSL